MSYDVLVVGAGFAGLSASALLGKAGLRVAVAEQDRQVGGRAKVIETKGFIFEYGVHSYRYGARGAAAGVLEELASPVEWIHEPVTSYVIQGRELFALPDGAKKDKDKAPHLCNRNEVKRVREIMGMLASSSSDEWYGKSFSEFLGKDASDEKLRVLFRALGFGLMEPDPDKLSAGELIAHLKKALAAGLQSAEPKGGTREILNRLVNCIEENEGRILLRTKVQELRINRKKFWEAITSRGNIHADAIIYAAPLQGLFSVIDKRLFKTGFIRQCENLKPTSGVAIDYGLSRRISDVKGWLMDVDEGILARFPSNLDPGIAPAGKQISSWFLLLEPEETGDRKVARSRIRQLKAAIKNLYPDFFDSVEFERIMVLPIVDGADLNTHQCRPRRPDLSCREIKNLFFIGDTTSGEGVSGDIAFNSAREVVPRIKEFLGRA